MPVQVIPAKKTRVRNSTGEIVNKKRVAAYCRVSTDSDEQENSYDAQCQHYKSYISQNPDWISAGIYADEGISGTQTKYREEFNRMIADCEAGKIDLILTKSISRFSRNTVDCLQNIRKLKAMGIAVFFEKENINTLDAKGEVLITIMVSIAQQESQSISDNVKMGIRYGMQEGRGLLNTSMFLGLKKGKNKGELEIELDEAEIVRRIFREFLNGYSANAISEKLEKEGVKPPSGKNKWYASTVNHIIENEKYCGDLLMQKYYVEDFLTHRIVKNDQGKLPQYYVEDHHDPIVPREVFFQAQGEMTRRSAYRKDPNKIRIGARVALLGRLICGRCGQLLKRYQVGETQEWRCGKRARKLKTQIAEAVCGSRRVRECEVKEAVAEAFNRLPDYRDDLIRKQGELWNGDLKRIDMMIEKDKEREMQLEERRQVLLATDDESNELAFLDEQIESLRQEREMLALERADAAYEDMQVRMLLELVDEMNEKKSSTAGQQKVKKEQYGAACRDYEEFFRRTRVDLGRDIISDLGKLRYFDDEVVIRFVKNVTVTDDGYVVNFKAGINIPIQVGTTELKIRV